MFRHSKQFRRSDYSIYHLILFIKADKYTHSKSTLAGSKHYSELAKGLLLRYW